jgi:hypothetical protein
MTLTVDLEELLDFTLTHEQFQTTKDYAHVKDILRVLLDKDRLILAYRDGQIVGYIESWRLSFEQLGRVILDIPFNIESEDIETGEVCFLSNITIHPDHRGGSVMRELRNEFILQNRDASYWIGHAQRKSVGLIKHYDLSKLNL